MLIGIDGNEANVTEKVGVNQYAWQILVNLHKLQDNNLRFRIYLKNPPNEDMPRSNPFWEYKIFPSGKFWVLTGLMPRLLTTEKLDVFFSPSHYLPIFSRAPMICTIHDLGYLKFSGQFRKYDFWQLKYWSAISISVSKYIISPSKSTANDIVRHYPFASKKVKIIYHGFDKDNFNTKISKNFVRRILKKYRIYKKYILFLSTLKPSKNVEGLLEAYKNIVKEFDCLLVIAGKKGWLYHPIFKKIKDLKLEKNVLFTGYVSEKEKAALLTAAELYVLPSFWEGFGMDVLSSMACGTPVVVSKVASLPEIVKDAGIYVNPYNIESIAGGLKTILSMSQKEKNKLIERGLKRVKNFSWQKSARETLDLLENTIKSP